jgi:hypothetical protein
LCSFSLYPTRHDARVHLWSTYRRAVGSSDGKCTMRNCLTSIGSHLDQAVQLQQRPWQQRGAHGVWVLDSFAASLCIASRACMHATRGALCYLRICTLSQSQLAHRLQPLLHAFLSARLSSDRRVVEAIELTRRSCPLLASSKHNGFRKASTSLSWQRMS